MLITKSAVRRYALDMVAQKRPHLVEKKTRVGKEFIQRAEAHLAAWIQNEIENLNSSGKTIK